MTNVEITYAPADAGAAEPVGAASPPHTLAIDIGGTGLKASVLDAHGAMVVDRVRVPTTYPLAPTGLVAALAELVKPLPDFDRVSAGFPGVVRKGCIVTAPHFSTAGGPGTAVDPDLLTAWTGFDLAGELERLWGKPTKVVNDADLQGAAVVSGSGLELVVTLGTGVGTGVFLDGQVAPHLEIAHHPFRKGETYNEQLGEAARKRIGPKKWNKRVEEALANLDVLLNPDRTYIGGGNSKHLTLELSPTTTVVDNAAGILGGIKLWETSGHLT
ncbi:MAG: ROK family protein [Acidimicrobiia bacterium]|nr:ROK family protein [Acidimicrobiia bacterium]